MDDTLTKPCSICGEMFPKTEEFFRLDRYSGRFRAACRTCERARARELSKGEERQETVRRWREKNPDYFRYWRAENAERIHELISGWRQRNPERYRQILQRAKNRVRVAKPRFVRSATGIAQGLSQKEYQRQYAIVNAERKRANERRRLERKRALPATLTREQWRKCLEWWNHSCAYCGSQDCIEKDHCRAVSLGGGYTVDNMLPACRSCNKSKHNTPAKQWIERRFEHQSEEILLRIQEYFEWTKSQE